jgi:hypothetical protein
LRDKISNLELRIIKSKHIKDILTEKCRGDPQTKIKAQIMDYRHKNRSSQMKVQHLMDDKEGYVSLCERMNKLIQHLLVTHSATEVDVDTYINSVNEICQSNQHVDTIHKLLLLSCGVNNTIDKENNVDNTKRMDSAICLDIVKSLYHLNHIYNSINLK